MSLASRIIDTDAFEPVGAAATSVVSAMPYQVVTSRTASQNGQPHVYLADQTGKKVAAIWGGADQKFDTAYMLAAAPAMYGALQELLAADKEIVATLNDRDGNDRAINRQIAAERTAGEVLLLARGK